VVGGGGLDKSEQKKFYVFEALLSGRGVISGERNLTAAERSVKDSGKRN